MLVLARPTFAGDVRYRITDLTEIAEGIGVVQAEARSVNARGQVVGFELLPEFEARIVVWDADLTPSFVDPLPGDNTTIANLIGDDGTIYGQSVKVTVERIGHQIRVYLVEKAAYWRGGDVFNLNDEVTHGGEGINLHFIRGMDDTGRLLGYAGSKQGPPYRPFGFLFDEGVVTDLGALARPEAMNHRNQIVGYSGSGQDKAYLWDDGNLVNLHDHENIGGVTSRAYDINDDAMIVGEVQFHISKPEEPAVWIEGVPTRLVPDINRPQGVAYRILDDGTIIGWFNDLDDLESPWIGAMWKDGERIELLDLVDPEEGWGFVFPFDINEDGVIVGGGMRNGRIGRAFLMTPIMACGGRERIASARCSDRGGRTLLKIRLKGGAPGDTFTVTAEGGVQGGGVVGPKGKAKARLRGVPGGAGAARAEWGCGAQAERRYECP
ncbi:MAG: hypothetical protein C4547_10185 [Phycisphaerales bacterium]|nr:MAG: hypothetical protein C4547_10185 [Phycisphaerales bacterium]